MIVVTVTIPATPTVVVTSGFPGPQGLQGPIGPQGIQGPIGPVGPIGPQGIQGPIGPEGPMGQTGAIGQTGAMGPRGMTGENGARGPIGPQGIQGEPGLDGLDGADSIVPGPQGPIGLTGPRGFQGEQGIQGLKGDRGDQGATGLQGLQGPIGLTGPKGENSIVPGPQGHIGLTGPQGPKGEDSIVPGPQGLPGANGTNGIDGQDGAEGPQGPRGIQGFTGDQGPAGPAGPAGQNGLQGIQGLQGLQGPQGLKGNDSIVPGPEGPQGPRGFQGLQGDKGETGSQGTQGLTGPRGLQGEQGIAGEDSIVPGPQGIQGPIGLTGPRGLKGEDSTVPGPQGPEGSQGPRGFQGVPGDDGAPGPQGPIGLTGPQGLKGNDGAPGPQGPIGPQGLQGDIGPQGPAGTTDVSTHGTTRYVETERVDVYVENGSLSYPYKTIQGAINAILDATEEKIYTIELLSNKTVTENIVVKNHIHFTAKRYTNLIGSNITLPTVTVPITMTTEVRFENFFIATLATDPAVPAVLYHGPAGSTLDLFFTNVFGGAGAGVLVDNGGDITLVNSMVGGATYGIDASNNSTINMYTGLVSGGTNDIRIAAGSVLTYNSGSVFLNNGVTGAGIIVRTTNDYMINNTSTVAGPTVKDALDAIDIILKSSTGTGLTVYNNAPTFIGPIADYLTLSNTPINDMHAATRKFVTDFFPVQETNMFLNDVPTHNTTKDLHGFAPRLSDNAAQFLNGKGNWVTPSSGTTNDYSSTDFDTQTVIYVLHNFGSYPIVQVLIADAVAIPYSIVHDTVDSFTVTFSTPQSGTILATIGSPQPQALKNITDNYQALVLDKILLVTVPGKTITLYTAVNNTGKEIVVDNASTGDIYINCLVGGQTIQNETSQTIPKDCSARVYSTGSNFRIY